MILAFDRESIFRQTFLPQVAEAGERIIQVLMVLKKNASLNTSDLEEEIHSRERAKMKLAEKLQKERIRLSDKLRNKVQPSILADAEKALRQQADALASSLASGGSNFSMLVNNILRPVLVSSTQAYVENSFDEFVSSMPLDISGQGTDLNEIFTRYQKVNENLMKNLPETVDKFNGVYKAITVALAVTTTVVAPWLELVLIFLPDVIKLISPMFQQRQQDKILTEVNNRIIPGIIQKLGPEINSSLGELEEEIINEETAPVVRRMFEMCAAGIGARSIASTLNNEGILSPKEYTRFRKHNPERDGEFERRHFWTRTYVQFMLKNEIYVGSMVQGREYTPSYRSKKREPIPKEDWIVVPNMHEPIVTRELFDEAQKRMGARKKTIKAKDEPDLFAGLFFCEACGTSMLPKVSQQKYFYYNCGRSHAIGKLACSSHYINRDTFHQAVLEDIRRNAKLFSEDAEKAAQRLMELKCADQQKQTATMKRDIASAKKRLADLDVKLKRTYEDNMSGKLPDHIFTMFIADYDTERATLKANIAEMEKALEKIRDTKADIDRFADLIQKYTSFEKLDRFMLHELIDRITIYETPGMGRCRKGKEKRITIYYKFVGAIQ